jgi:hypothetical protein
MKPSNYLNTPTSEVLHFPLRSWTLTRLTGRLYTKDQRWSLCRGYCGSPLKSIGSLEKFLHKILRPYFRLYSLIPSELGPSTVLFKIHFYSDMFLYCYFLILLGSKRDP